MTPRPTPDQEPLMSAPAAHTEPAAWVADRYNRSVLNVAARLREAADQIERLTVDPARENPVGTPPFTYSAFRVSRVVSNTIPNLGHDHLITEAADAELALAALAREQVPEGDRAVVGGKPYGVIECPGVGWREGDHEGDTGPRLSGNTSTDDSRPPRTEPLYRLIPLSRPES